MLFPLPVMMYHSISRFKHRLCVSPEMFEEHCAVLSKAGWSGISLAEAEGYFLRRRRVPGKVCLFSFDDGYLDNCIYAEPILRAYGHCGVIFTAAGLIDTCDILRLGNGEGGIALTSDGHIGDSPDLDGRALVRLSAGYQVYPIVFSSWKELAAMRDRGAMNVAPHSMTHGRVVANLDFTRLTRPNDRHTFFDVPPYPAVWGMPRFRLEHGLVNRAYTIAPEVFELVRRMVPQEPSEAESFLSKDANRQAVMQAIRKLPCLGELESEASYRERLAAEFSACQEIFRERLETSPVSFCWPWGKYNAIAMQEARKAGFKVFFTTQRGINWYGGASAVRRFAVRSQSGEELLAKVRAASSVLQMLPFEVYSWGAKLLR